ncbi:DUF6933 domain-containing protein [Marivirga arenosa]|uniref:DUF6933 domain-containing protein n=1 Tax=Marivirga arenosa TaxID=3059076 RepID=A0AA49GEC9_9BACT|nr:hypothetical protein [Marivirga sp. BKB1-2]WKK82005.2 hypothetical protein QYS47_07505 [Marivirga sp. BKB1-2]
MPIHLYQSKKVQSYLGDMIYDINEPLKEQIDPLLIWYVDVYFIKRKRYLIIANPLTKFTFFIFRYSKKSHPDFLVAFKENLAHSLQSIDIDPEKYLNKCDKIYPITETNRSASAHLSRIKEDYGGMISTCWHDVYPPDDELFYNQLICENITTYGRKEYDFPKRRFYQELILRRWD